MPFCSLVRLIHFPLWSELYEDHQRNLRFFTVRSGRPDAGKTMDMHTPGLSSGSGRHGCSRANHGRVPGSGLGFPGHCNWQPV